MPYVVKVIENNEKHVMVLGLSLLMFLSLRLMMERSLML